MGFTTQIFLFVFLPVCLMVYYSVYAVEKYSDRLGKFLQKIRLRDIILILAGLGFYAWSCFDNLFRLLAYMLLIFVFGELIAKCRKADCSIVLEKKDKTIKYSICVIVTILLVAVVLFCLVYTKYWGQVLSVWNFLFDTEISARSITAPLAISFLTFSAVSYLVDISRGNGKHGNLLDCLLYLSFFPKIISGPTVLWKDFYTQIPDRKPELNDVADGITRIMIGFAKKVLIADTLGACIAKIPMTGIDIPTAWLGALLYMLQIYYDFAGYSDIAIGLAKLFGIHIKENFHFPYCSTSIGEFWRRWHISLGTWFREYVYYPLGGSRKGLAVTLRNLGIVFLLTGIWHGNGWNYIVWGAINGAFVILERLCAGRRVYEKTPKAVKWLATMAITLFCWEFFRFGSLSSVLQWGKIAVGLLSYQNIHTWQYYFDMQIIVIAVIGILGSTLFGMARVQELYQKAVATKVGYAIQQVALIALFVIAIMFMVSSGYSPFIYFQY